MLVSLGIVQMEYESPRPGEGWVSEGEGYKLDDLRIYMLACEYGDKVWGIVYRWGYFERSTLGRDWARAADSIGANIAEGYGRYHDGEDFHFLSIARGSLEESRHWTQRAAVRNLIEEGVSSELLQILKDLDPQLRSYTGMVKRRRRK